LAGRLRAYPGRFEREIMRFERFRKANPNQKTGKGIVTTCYKDDAKIWLGLIEILLQLLPLSGG
jgi:hypothetical protein